VLKEFGIQEGFELQGVKNEKCRVTIECKVDDCIRRIHASLATYKETYQIKSYEGRHTCIRTMKSSDANSTWIAKKLTSLLVADPHINYPTMRQVLLEKYGIVPSNDMQLSWVKRKVLEKNNGTYIV